MCDRPAKRFRIMLIFLLLGLQLVFGQSLGAEVLPDRSDINAFDRSLMYPYSPKLSLASDITQSIVLLSPALLALASPSSDWFEIAVLYGTSALLSYGTRTIMKSSIYRLRPYTYFSGSPDFDDIDESFPSGHSIMAFTGAAFTHMLFALRYPESKFRLPVTIGAWTLAGATVALRVASGNHFLTDVLTGAAIGSLFGVAVPLLAWKILPSWQEGRASLAIGPSIVAVALSF